MMRIEPITARGTVRFGSRLSSASGAAPSQPVRAKMANTTPRNRPCSVPALEPAVSQLSVVPPGARVGQAPQAERRAR